MSNIRLFLLLLVFCWSNASVAKRAMTAPELISLPRISHPQLTPDAKQLFFLKSEANWQKNRRVSQLWRQRLDTNELRQMTFGESSVQQPLLSPDGKLLLFIAERASDKREQLYLLHLDGGEAYRVVELEASPRRVKWTPDSKAVLFTSMTQLPEEQVKQVKDKRIIRRFEDPARQYVLFKLTLQNTENKAKVTQLTDENTSVSDFSLSPDGKQILLLRSSGVRIDQRHAADLWMMDLDGKDVQRLTRNQFYEQSAKFSTRSDAIAWMATVNEAQQEYHNSNLFVHRLKESSTTLLTADFVGDVEQFQWSVNGEQLYFIANIGVSTQLFKYDLQTQSMQQLTSGEFTITDWQYHRPSDAHILEVRSATSPGELWLWSEGQMTQLTDLFASLQAQYLLPRQESIQWQSHDGQPLEGLLSYPLSYEPGKSFPLVVNTHGGPRSSDQFGIWSTTDYIPVLAAYGYGVLMVNHRGGVGYGDDFLRDMVGQYFRNAHLDVISGVDYLISQGIADPDRLVKMGWSAGGHMTNKIITFTDRFKAASSGAGTVDWIAHYGESDTSYRRTWWFGGTPWQENSVIEAYIQNSVVKDLWKVKTPTLVFVGEKDVRVPPSQARILYRALRDVGVASELYIAPGEPHGFRRLSHRLFKINKELEWFEKYVNERAYQFQLPPDDDKNNEK